MATNETTETRMPGGLLSRMAAELPALLARIDRSTGRLLNPNGKFAIFDQHPIYALAFLYRCPGTEWQGRRELLEAACGMGDAILDLQNADGTFPFLKDDGSAWGNSTLPWHVGPWLEAERLLGEDLDPASRERWREGLARWMRCVARELSDNGRLHNIQAYCAAILVRGARQFGLPELEPIGEMFLRKVAALQTDDGYWPEGGCPTLIYNLVYLHALGLYHATTGAAWVRPHLERGLAFHLRFTYPDGTGVETVDGRVRHHREPFLLGGLAFLPFAEGRRLVARILDGHLATVTPGTVNGNLGYLLEHWPQVSDAAAPPQQSEAGIALDSRALTRRSGDWFWCLSGLGCPAAERQRFLHHRWHNDMGQRLSLSHARLGLVAGGGGSRLQPAFQTFSVVTGGALHFAPDAAQVEATASTAGWAGVEARPHGLESAEARGGGPPRPPSDADAGGEDVLRLSFGPILCTLGVRQFPDGTVTLRWRAEWPESARDVGVTAGLTLPYLLDREARSSLAGTKPETLGALKDLIWIERPLAPVPPWTLTVGGLELALPAGTTFHWPEYPFNPYAINNTAPPEGAVGALSFNLNNGEDRLVNVRVRG